MVICSMVFLTFFCKKERHDDCPGTHPVGDRCGPDHDCSFDVKIIKCECMCHNQKIEK